MASTTAERVGTHTQCSRDYFPLSRHGDLIRRGRGTGNLAGERDRTGRSTIVDKETPTWPQPTHRAAD
jgi:hypothetical protein